MKTHKLDTPKIIQMPVLPPFVERSRFIATCSIQKGDTPLYFQWKKNGQTITQQSQRIKVDSTTVMSTLSIDSIIREDAANYSCIVRNAFGEDSQNVVLTVKASLKWIKEPKDTKVTIGEDLSLFCEADGFPIPKITWINAKSDKVLSEGKQLQLKKVSLEESHSYKCVAENGEDKPLTKSFSVKVVGKNQKVALQFKE
ncbi:Down syndrome cell adhesion molecule-like protein 1-like protein [Leptotrombidium deliense]|uniref:Down syndrome cell adhesion molecule-like protein 1-like protein n=1 Tax=Leptotrombidium deliense TaxID=299467 RepID=A0A443RWI9_9ACAR|nr:Down syndrome cell adhesion molecule-like protein 1-like protein [Leptotrombidium deliense]